MRTTIAVLAGLVAMATAAVAAGFQRVPVERATVSLPERWTETAAGDEVPVWLHLHGATETVEREFASIGAPGALVTLTLPGLSRVYADYCAAPEAWTRLLAGVETALRTAAPGREWKAGRVTVSAFSAGFGGVREWLKQPEVQARIATLVMADSIYCGYAGDAQLRRIDPVLMQDFVRFAREAAEGRKRFVVTHSAQIPDGYASTTETADYLIAAVDATRVEVDERWAENLRQTSAAGRGQFEVLGFSGAAAEDHLGHLRGLGQLYARVAPPIGRPAANLAELRAQLDAHTGHARYRGAMWGVKVVSLETGGTLYERGAETLLSPASNAKLYTGALALEALGGDYRIVTPILATVPPDPAGALRGNLIVSGRGDPSWNSGPARGKFAEIFAPFVHVVAAAGVRRVAGDVVADATFFRGPAEGAGWTADDLNYYYGAELSAVAVEDNYADLRIEPGAVAGAPARIALVQPHTGLRVENRLATVAAGVTRRIDVRRLVGGSTVYVSGRIPLGSAAVIEDATVPRPAQWFAAGLRAALAERGIAVEGRARSVRWPEPGESGPERIKLGEVVSPQLHELVEAFMKPSQNLQTDLIFGYLGERERALAEEVGAEAETPAAAGTVERSTEEMGVRALQRFLKAHALYPDDVRFEEGSGLSRNNMTTARATVALLRFMAAHREAEAFRRSLPVAGVDGTLRRRFKDTPAEGNVQAKTGSLRWANSLAGYVTTAAGEPLAFCVMLNRAVVPPGRSARDDIDAVAEMLARFSGRSGLPPAR